MGRRNPASGNAVEKLCAVLKAVGQSAPARLSDVAQRTGLHKTTALRLLTALEREGFVTRAEDKMFGLGTEARMLALTAPPIDVVPLAQPSLLRMAERSTDTALLSIRREVEAIYVGRAVGSHPLQPSYLRIGSRRLLGVGAGSLALLAWLPDLEMSAVVDIVVSRQPPRSRITKPLLKERIAEARKQGYTILVDAAYEGMGGIGFPIRDESGAVIAAISIGAATDRILARVEPLASALRQEANLVSKLYARKVHRRTVSASADEA